MRERVRDFYWRTLLSVALLGLAFACGVILSSCGGGGEVAGPSAPVQQSTPAPAPVAAAVTPTVVPTPDPAEAQPYVELNKADGSGWLFNPTNHPVTFTIEIWNATDYWAQKLLAKLQRTVEAGKSAELEPSAKLVRELACGIKLTIQLDVSTTSHLGHAIFDIQTEACCVEEWKELEPEVTYTDWSECKRAESATTAPACSQSRTKTTVIKEQNTCTKEIREKSRKSETETRPCECVCVEEWKELPPVVTYGEWGECAQAPADCGISCQPKCYQSRKVRTVIEEKNSCTGATRVKSDTSATETRECPCKVSCVRPPEGAVLSWTGAGDPTTECKAFEGDGYGPYMADEATPTWFICKAGNDREVFYSYPTGTSCSNGKDISHITGCDCLELR